MTWSWSFKNQCNRTFSFIWKKHKLWKMGHVHKIGGRHASAKKNIMWLKKTQNAKLGLIVSTSTEHNVCYLSPWVDQAWPGLAFPIYHFIYYGIIWCNIQHVCIIINSFPMSSLLVHICDEFTKAFGSWDWMSVALCEIITACGWRKSLKIFFNHNECRNSDSNPVGTKYWAFPELSEESF